MKIRNLTPHPLVIFSGDTIATTIAPEAGQAPIRVEIESTPVIGVHVGGVATPVALFSAKCGEVIGLPEQEFGVLLFVSDMVRTAAPRRRDLISPNEVVRDQQGRVVGLKSFKTNATCPGQVNHLLCEADGCPEWSISGGC